MSDLVGPYADRNDDTEGLLIMGQESFGAFRSVKSTTGIPQAALS